MYLETCYTFSLVCCRKRSQIISQTFQDKFVQQREQQQGKNHQAKRGDKKREEYLMEIGM